MDGDDEPSVLGLEQLLSSPFEDDGSRDSPFYEEGHIELLGNRLKALLAAVLQDDPLMQTTRHKPPSFLTRLEGPFTVQEVPGKGLGVIASRRIPGGSIILDDPFAISIQQPKQVSVSECEANCFNFHVLIQLLEQYIQLPSHKREQFADLHPHMEPGSREWFREQLEDTGTKLSKNELDFIVRLYYTFNTNEFSKLEPGQCGTWTVRRLFLLTARINHSCCPNARSRQTSDGYKVVTALRDIEENEEITLKYLDHVRFSRDGWRAITQRTWGFVCDCKGCRFKAKNLE